MNQQKLSKRISLPMKDYNKLKKKLERVVLSKGGTYSDEQKAKFVKSTYVRNKKQFHVTWHGTPSAKSTMTVTKSNITLGLEELGLTRKSIRQEMVNKLIVGDEANIFIFNETNAQTRELAQLHRMLDKMGEME
jgi:hypothetical protein